MSTGYDHSDAIAITLFAIIFHIAHYRLPLTAKHLLDSSFSVDDGEEFVLVRVSDS